MYPKVLKEMQRQNLSGLQLMKKAKLNYQTVYPKIKRGAGGKIALEEAIAIKKALGVDMKLEDLFKKVV